MQTRRCLLKMTLVILILRRQLIMQNKPVPRNSCIRSGYQHFKMNNAVRPKKKAPAKKTYLSSEKKETSYIFLEKAGYQVMLESLRQRTQGWKHFPGSPSKGNCCSSTAALAVTTNTRNQMFSVITVGNLCLGTASASLCSAAFFFLSWTGRKITWRTI